MTSASVHIGQNLTSADLLGRRIRDRRTGASGVVTEIFRTAGYPAMLLAWIDRYGKPRGQAFTTKDFEKRWEVTT